ncbi:MAG: vWA domain-containing protein [Candidatus Anammoxibacter sp.]
MGENLNEIEVENKEPEQKKKKRGIIWASIFFLLFIAIIISVLLLIKAPRLEVAPSNIEFGAYDVQKNLVIRNVAKHTGFLSYFNFLKKPLGYEISMDKHNPWISVLVKSGTIAGFEEDGKNVTIKIDRTKLNIGNNKGTIFIESNGGDKTITVTAIREKDAIRITNSPVDAQFMIGNESIIRWDATIGVSDSVNVYLCLNECVIETIVNNYDYRSDDTSPGEFKWMPGDALLPGGNGYTIRVEDADNSNIFDQITPISLNYQITKIRFDNIEAAHQRPSTVQYIFSLRDQYNHAVIFDPSEIDWNSLNIWENREQIDYLESRALLSSQDDFQMQVMLVLDFSASMRENRNGIETMVKGANTLIESIKETHQVGVVEFHGPQSSPAILQPFISNKDAAKKAIADFVSKAIYSDFSICWDAVYKGLEQFPEKPNPKIFKVLVFLSDGFDNSSECVTKDLIALANSRSVHIYNIGVGDVHEEKVLENISTITGGIYVRAENMCVLLERFQQIIRDLGGQYKITYITPKKPKDKTFTIKSEITYNGVKSIPPLKRKIEVSSIYGDTIRGLLSFTSSRNIKDKKSEIFLWCEHSPRYVQEFRFKLGIDETNFVTISLISANNGGLCSDWKIVKDGNGWYRLKSSDTKDIAGSLGFGSNGPVCKIVVKWKKEFEAEVAFQLDNSIYTLGQSFYNGKDSEIDDQGNWKTIINTGGDSKDYL